MECNVPTDIVFSFTGLRQRGGKTGPHADGWGLAFYEGRGTRIFLDPEPACSSPLARFVAEHPIKTLLAIGHTPAQIAAERNVALSTVRSQIRILLSRTGLHRIAELVILLNAR